MSGLGVEDMARFYTKNGQHQLRETLDSTQLFAICTLVAITVALVDALYEQILKYMNQAVWVDLPNAMCAPPCKTTAMALYIPVAVTVTWTLAAISMVLFPL